MVGEESYARQWREYRRRKWTALFFFIGFFTLAIVLATAVMLLTHSKTAAQIVLLCWLLASLLTSLRFHLWECPRCGRRFIGYYNIFSYLRKRCFYCALPVGSNPSNKTVHV